MRPDDSEPPLRGARRVMALIGVATTLFLTGQVTGEIYPSLVLPSFGRPLDPPSTQIEFVFVDDGMRVPVERVDLFAGAGRPFWSSMTASLREAGPDRELVEWLEARASAEGVPCAEAFEVVEVDRADRSVVETQSVSLSGCVEGID